MKTSTRSNMKLEDLREAGATHVAQIDVSGNLKTNVMTYPDMSATGFYFLVDRHNSEVVARFYVGAGPGNNSSFENTVAQIRLRRTAVARKIMDLETYFDVYFIKVKDMKPVIKDNASGKVAELLGPENSTKYSSISELNKLLNTNFKFRTQTS